MSKRKTISKRDRFEVFKRDNFRLTVKNFNNSLGVESVINAMEKACIKIYYDEQKVLKYFCGICWNKIKENE